MTSPIRNNVALRYLESINDSSPFTSPTRMPLEPTSRFNAKSSSEDLDKLALQLDIHTDRTPSKTPLLRTSYETPSVTVSSFKSPSTTSSRSSSPVKRNSKLTFETPTLKKGSSNIPSLLPDNDNIHKPYLSSPGNSTSTDSPGYTYLCRILGIKNWLETVLDEEIEFSPAELINEIRKGIHLAKLANVILPTKRAVFTNPKLQFRHTENINRFFKLLDFLSVPDLFRFELTDLYDAKNVPKVWVCLHAISYMLNKTDSSYSAIKNLVGRAEFSADDIRTANRALITTGLPSFDSTDPNDENNAGESTYMNRALGSSPVKLGSLKQNKKEASPTKENPFEERKNVNITPSRKSVQTVRTPSAQIIHRPSYLDDTNYKNSSYYNPELEAHMTNIIKLQALSRGASFRYRMFVDKIIIRSYHEEFTDFVSIIRGNLSRAKTVHRHRDEVLRYKYDVVDLQAIARGKLSRGKHSFNLSSSTSSIISLQSLIRGQTQRYELQMLKYRLSKHAGTISELQAKMKMLLIHSKAKTLIDNKDLIENSIIQLQSVARLVLYQRNVINSMISNLKNSGGLVALQALIRGKNVRKSYNERHRCLLRTHSNVKQLQSVIRGGVARTRLCNNVLITLMHEDITLNDVYAKVRGNNIRRIINRTRSELNANQVSVVKAQTLIRGVLSRFRRDVLLEDAYDHILSIIDLQALIKGKKLRSQLNAIDAYYYKNLDRVIKCQAIIKSNFAQRAYKSLIGMKNPPLSVIKRFAYLLGDNDRDFEQELELSELKDKIIERSKANQELETAIENLDIKLTLLDRNKISIEEFMKNKFKSKANKDSSNELNAKNLEKLNKSSRERMEAYQSLFYLIQTKPDYLIRLHESMDIKEKGTNDYQQLQSYLLLLFPVVNSSITHHSREEFFLMKLVGALMKTDMQMNCRTPPDITKSSCCFWIDFFLHFNNHTYQRMHLKNLFGQFVASLIDDDEADFESDPSAIHEMVIEKEIRVSGHSERERDLSPQVAIKQAEVSEHFVANLMQLREYSTVFLNLIELSVIRFPLHVKLAAKDAYELSKNTFPERSEKQHLAVAGVIVIKLYVAAILNNPENFGLQTRDPYSVSGVNVRAKNNLRQISKVMVQMFALKPFSDNFLKPLNDYLSASSETCVNIIQKLIDVGTLESEYKLTDYDDIVARERPKLSIRVSDMIQVEKIIHRNIDIVAPSSDDQLYSLVNKLYNSVNFADDLASLTELGSVTLTLSPTTKEETIADTKGNALLTQAKRSILYVIRVQEGSDLLELLASGIKPVHEEKFKEISQSEKRREETNPQEAKRKAYHTTSLGDLSRLTYRDLKKNALDSLLQLEAMGLVTRRDSFQDILNQIAVDIRTKHQQRVMRQSQYAIAVKTNQKLIEKEAFLKQQHKDFSDHIEGVLAQLQSKPKDKKLFNIIPIFSKQYFYQRELRKSNRLPKFGSYKYSAKKLMDIKVLKDFGGAMSDRYGTSSKLDFMFSCHKAGTFTIEAASGSVSIPGAHSIISLDQLLNLQYESKETFEAFDGMVIFDTTAFVSFLLSNFYDIKKE